MKIGCLTVDSVGVEITGVGSVEFPDPSKEAPVMGLPPMGYGIDGSNANNDSSSLLTNAARSAIANSVSTTINSSGNTVTSYSSIDASSFASGFAINTALGMDSYQQALQSFPILEIVPLNANYNPTKPGTTPNTKKADVSYKFAIDPHNLTITYNHSNTYQESNIENSMKSMTQWDTTNAVRQLSGTMGNMLGEDTQKILDTFKVALADNPANKALSHLTEILGAKDETTGNDVFTEFQKNAINTGKAAMETYINTVKGAKIDFPNIWTDAQTQSSQNFTIQLRTLSTSPKSKQYCREILLPLYCLLTLALPPGGAGNTYFNPPYITCNLDNGFYEVLLGGISNITVEFPTSELNFLKVPRHVTVTLTIVDMYNVMPQNIMGQTIANPDLTTKDVLMKRFAEMPGNRTVYNADLYSREYKWTDWGGSTVSASAVIVGAEALADATNINFAATKNGILGMTSFFNGRNAEIAPDQDQSFSIRPYVKTLDSDESSPISDTISNHLSIYFPNDVNKGNVVIEGAGIEIGTLKRVKNVTSTTASANVAVRDLVSGKSPLELSKGYTMSLQLNGETPEISQSFLNSVTSKVCTSLKNLFT